MKQLLLITLLMVCTITTAQVGINTTDPKSTLDITASNSSSPSITDGILIPRISNFPGTNPTEEQQSMLVYLTVARTGVNINGTPQDYGVGFYYWDNTIPNWVAISPEGSTDWKTTGNNDAISGTHFIGTTNNQEVDFRVNNKFVGRLTELGQFELQADELSLFIGFEAGEAYDPDNTASEHNTFIGYQTGKATNSGRDNVAVGTLSLTKNTTGDFNTAVGDETLENNTFGSRNTAIGNDALRQNTSGGNNTAIGQTALVSNSSGINNTAVGINAGLTNQTGSNNVFVGVNADANGTDHDLSVAIGRNAIINGDNATAIGHEATANANEVILGNTAVTRIGGYASWSNISDGRFKFNVKEDIPGLQFITQLRPVSYNLDRAKISAFKGEETRSKNDLTYIESGFIAQEVDALSQKLGYNFNGVQRPEDVSKNHYTISYSSFVVPLVKAVQEQQEVIETQNEKIDALEARLKKLESLIEGLK